MANIPYRIVDQVTLAGNGQANLQYSVPNNWNVELLQEYFLATGAFDIIQYQDNNGQAYSNTSINKAVHSTFLSVPNTANISVRTFPTPLKLKGGGQILITVLDKSGSSNTIEWLAEAIAHIPGNEAF